MAQPTHKVTSVAKPRNNALELGQGENKYNDLQKSLNRKMQFLCVLTNYY